MFQVIILGEAERDGSVGLPADELLQERIGVGADFLGRALGDNLPLARSVAQHEHVGGDAKAAGHIVADDHRGDADLARAIEGQLIDHRGHDGIEARGGFVAKEEFGIEGEGAGEADSFAHASAEFGGFEVFETSQADQLQFHFDDHFDEGGVDLAMLEKRQGDIFAHGHGLEKGTKLEVHSEPKSDTVELLRGCLGDVLPEKVNGARGGFLGADQNSQESGFSATAATHDDKGFASPDFEIEAVEDGPSVVALHQILDLEDDIGGGLTFFRGGAHRAKKKRPVRMASAIMIQRME